MIVCGAAEFAAGALGERQGEALLLLELCVEALQPGASGGPDEGCVEEPVAVEHGRDVAAAEGVLDLIGQLREPAVHGRVAGMCHTGFPALDRFTYLNTASAGLVPTLVITPAHEFELELAQAGTTGMDEDAEVAILEDARQGAAGLLGTDPAGDAPAGRSGSPR